MDTLTCLLPGGYADGTGTLHREAELAPLSGREEELLAGRSNMSNAALVTRILSRCVKRIGTCSAISEAIVRDLLVADRQYLMLKLRELTFSSRVQATVVCPWPDCSRRVDIDFLLGDVPLILPVDPGPTYRFQLSAEAALYDEQGVAHRDVVFRLPTGGDQEFAAALALQDGEQALMQLMSRCIRSIGDLHQPDAALLGGLSPLARTELDQAMEAVTPRVDLNIAGLCPECGREFVQPFDMQEFFFSELRISREQLYREVHYLAYHYHWSEHELTGLPRSKRRMYIAILADEIERLNDAVV
ncbi:hypothetical protein EYB53_020425 [Candidatus Chloroploca sp. M-50]|uniref:DUF6760 domain-containing protein n=1 Tax=Candidatus Chloroploca mongolica TaxID=2528176 RepID=A0ABS4DF87_9CHLR|nr:DUF6760 family protein [Candidatus Chloroploca mongolica]MBP1468091.1 hypothetical protein [Candidatus Chloroploca mongolica]